MAKETPEKYWRFKLDTRRSLNQLRQLIENINTNGGGGTSGGGGISEITSEMVVSALGYTPYNASNPSGYITVADLAPYLKAKEAQETYATKDLVNNKLTSYATIVSVTAIQNTLTGQIGAVGARVEQLATTKLDSSYFTLTNIKSTLGISDWALAATKPSYAWSEITSRPTALSQFTDDVVAGNYLPIGGTAVKANTISLNGISANTTYGEYAGIIQSHTGGAEEGAWHNSLRILHNNSSGYYTEICQNFTGTDALYYRRMENGSLSAWHRVLDERGGYINENAYLKFTSIDGQGGKFGYYKMDNPTLGNYVEFFNDSSKVGIHLHDNGEIYTYRGGRYTNVDSGNINNYTAGAALKLAYSHTLWGQSFDGTSDVTGSLSGVVNLTASGNITADSITIGGITLSVVNGALKIAGSAYTTGAFTVGA